MPSPHLGNDMFPIVPKPRFCDSHHVVSEAGRCISIFLIGELLFMGTSTA
jgi:hypothetical protein